MMYVLSTRCDTNHSPVDMIIFMYDGNAKSRTWVGNNITPNLHPIKQLLLQNVVYDVPRGHVQGAITIPSP